MDVKGVVTRPTGRRGLVVNSDDVYEWWDRFFDYLRPRVNDFDILYRDEWAGVVARLLPVLACVGWTEEDRGRIAVLNPVCVHRDSAKHSDTFRYCLNAAKLAEVGVRVLRCTDGVRMACASQGRHYRAKYSSPIIENYVHIAKIGPLKNFAGDYG